MTINIREVGGVTILDLEGRLSLGDPVRELEAEAKRLLAEKKCKLLLNVDKVSYVDSSGVGTLVRCLTSAKVAGGDLKVIKPSERVRQIFKITNLVQILEMFDNEQEAVASFA